MTAERVDAVLHLRTLCGVLGTIRGSVESCRLLEMNASPLKELHLPRLLRLKQEVEKLGGQILTAEQQHAKALAEQLEEQKEKRIAHLQQMAARRMFQAALSRGWQTWLDQWEERQRQQEAALAKPGETPSDHQHRGPCRQLGGRRVQRPARAGGEQRRARRCRRRSRERAWGQSRGLAQATRQRDTQQVRLLRREVRSAPAVRRRPTPAREPRSPRTTSEPRGWRWGRCAAPDPG